MITNTNGGFLITQIKQVSGRIFDRLLQASGVSAFNGAQGRILYVLWQQDSVPIAEIVKKTGLAKNTLTVMLDRMESAGLVHRRSDSRDRRRVTVSLTEKARGLQTQYDDVSNQINAIYYAGFSEQEVREFEAYLVRILNNLTQQEEKHGENIHIHEV